MDESLTSALIDAGFKKRKLAELSIPASFYSLEFQPELFPLSDKSGNAGLLILTVASESKAAYFELKKIKANKNGVLKAVICDFCYTLQPGNRIGLITFNLNREKTKSVAHYICADLSCSLHVRGLTDVLDYAKAQIREDITIEDRIRRLQKKSAAIFGSNGAVYAHGG